MKKQSRYSKFLSFVVAVAKNTTTYTAKDMAQAVKVPLGMDKVSILGVASLWDNCMALPVRGQVFLLNKDHFLFLNHNAAHFWQNIT